MATLFSYFKKSGSSKSKSVCNSSGNTSSDNPSASAKNTNAERTELHKEIKGNVKVDHAVSRSEEKGDAAQESSSCTCGDIVWAKLHDYPWWPSMICEHPKSKKFEIKDENNEGKIHVQFFGEPPSRDWVLKRDVAVFTERQPSAEADVQYAYAAANRAIQLDVAKRLQVYYSCKLSDEEDNSEDVPSKRRVKKRSTESRSQKRPRKRLKILDSDDDDSDNQENDDGGDHDDDDDDSTYEPDGGKSDDHDDYKSEKSEDEDSGSATSEDEIETSGKRKRQAKNSKGPPEKKSASANTNVTTPMSNKLNSSLSRAQASLAKFSPATVSSPQSLDIGEGQDFVHLGLKFLKDGQRKDKSMKLHTDPDYDPRTLHVPQAYIDSKAVTPGMKQWWTLKRDLYAAVLFFKVGKFYELYHMDAVVGVKELGLLYMKGSFAHCGFPEIGYSRYSEGLIQKGYKVARVEQTETPQELAARCGGKVVRREVCAVTSKGTRTFSFMEGQSDGSTSNYLLAFVERPSNAICLGGSEFGVCFVDTSIGKFYMGQFMDDRQSSRFLTMISQYPPAQVLFERNKVSAKVQHILLHELLPTIREALTPGSEFWSATKTLKHLHENNYFNDENNAEAVEWPATLKEMLADGDCLGLEASEKYQHAISALGACTWYLKKCCIHVELLSMSQFEKYIPSDNIVLEKRPSTSTLPQNMILDGVTLTNLDIVINDEGTTAGTLLELLDHCTTPFGKRYFKQWLCMPSCSKKAIQSRLDAVEDLMKLNSVVSGIQGKMKTMPDLERLLRRIHTLGSLKRSNDHPDSRAVFYNEDTYSKKKISDLLCAIEGFQKSELLIDLLQENISSLNSPMLKSLLHKDAENEKGQFPDLMPTLKFFKTAFDHKVAKETGTIHPKPGVLAQYDEAMEELKCIEQNLENYLKQQRKRLGCSTIKYWGTGRNRHQLEIPESALRSSTPNDYHLASQKKGFKRFVSDTTKTLNEKLVIAEEKRDGALKDTLRSIFNQFDKKHVLWEKAVRCLATLDCLMCLAHYSSNLDGVSCRPEIVHPVDADGKEIQPFFEILNCRHPCAQQSLATGDFIPNDIVLGKEEESKQESYPCCVLVTGPNMGGKSTLMRQAGVILIMAQLGCYVPAEVCRFTPVDRIFTRLGARDRILHGESTFFVELSETSTIFQHATKHSLVLLDELGRGTATYDGTSIASAVVYDLANRIRCRTLFSTHYHTLVDDFSNVSNIKLGHMACMVEKDDEENDDPSQETITFLYKFTSGACPKSYGFNAAKLAGLPMPVIKKAYRKAVEFEETSRNMRMFRKLLNSPAERVKDIISLIA